MRRAAARFAPAALVTARAFMKHDDALFAIGLVLFDTHYTRIAAVTASADEWDGIVDTVRELIRGDRYLLGIRPRRYRHARPVDWRQLRRPGLQRE